MNVKANMTTRQLIVVGTFIWLVVMFAFTFTDYLTREWTQNSRGWSENPTVLRGENGDILEEGVHPPTVHAAPAQ